MKVCKTQQQQLQQQPVHCIPATYGLALGLPKQMQVKVDWYELFCFGSTTVNLLMSMCDFLTCDGILFPKLFCRYLLAYLVQKALRRTRSHGMKQWDLQNKETLTRPAQHSFVLKVLLCHLRPSIIYSIPCDRLAKGLLMAQIFGKQAQEASMSV